MNYVREMNFVVLVLAVIAFAIATGLAHLLNRSDEKLQKAREEIVRLVALSESLHETEFEHSQLLEQQRLQDQAAIADLVDALTDCQEQCKALERQTVEVDAVIPARPKRNSKGQFAKKVESE